MVKRSGTGAGYQGGAAATALPGGESGQTGTQRACPQETGLVGVRTVKRRERRAPFGKGGSG